jgi:tRNA(adenine34) deaminase
VQSDIFWMRQALDLANYAAQQGEVPVGAVLVKDDEIIGRGWNQMIQQNDPTAHAEILAIREAALKLRNTRLIDATLYVTLEPCCMCAGAIVHARLSRIVFGARDFKTGAAGSVYNLLRGHPLNHAVIIDESALQPECSEILSQFFSKLRN